MMKRLISFLLVLTMLLPGLTALADTPKPIDTIPYEELQEPREGMHHYLLL